MTKEKQCFPVERKTSWEGRLRHFIPNNRQALGKEASQLTLKCAHCRQFGALSGSAGGPESVLKEHLAKAPEISRGHVSIPHPARRV